MGNKVKPALIGGVVLGLLSVIPVLDTCCCIWAILGGMLASYLFVKGSPTPASAGDGAVVGALAAVVGIVLSLILGIPIAILTAPFAADLADKAFAGFDPQIRVMMRNSIEASGTVAGAIQSGLIRAVLLFIFGIIGGLIGIPLFEKRKGGPVPPPPPTSGGTPDAA